MKEHPRPLLQEGGFTLIELLTVIGIIVVLTALTFGSMSKIKESTQRAGCASNLKQIGAAATQYAQDNNGTYPLSYDLVLGVKNSIATGLIDRLGEYVGPESSWKIFYCTDAEHCLPPPTLMESYTYKYQQRQTGSARFAYIGYYWLVSTCRQWRPNRDLPPIKLTGSPMRALATCPHFGGGVAHKRNYNVLFADGHTEARKADGNGYLINYINQQETEDGQEALTFAR
jgi:prepilin-type N-terminal cleavage/methylation domain-containing protein/prepilin-type processing-associated H-X9-DG protein